MSKGLIESIVEAIPEQLIMWSKAERGERLEYLCRKMFEAQNPKEFFNAQRELKEEVYKYE